MDKIEVRGGAPLSGQVRIAGAKNAALPLMAASLLSEEALVLANVPHLADIATLAHLLAALGVEVVLDGTRGGTAPGGRVMALTARTIGATLAPYDVVRKMRASILVLGPLVARAGEAVVSLPGGCAIGTRPVDLHLKGLRRLGAELELRDGYVHARAPRGLRGATIRFPFVSVGATENLMMAASLARGTTVLDNAAREPEVVDLANCLTKMGAQIMGIGTEQLVIEGVARLGGATHEVLPDRIEISTYAAAAAASGGEIELLGARLDLIGAVVAAFDGCGVAIEESERGVRVRRRDGGLRAIDLTTQPYPGFPTDMQAQMMAVLATATGASTITEAIFENRFMHVPELCRMGAQISLHGSAAVIQGVPRLRGAPVMATDLRASVSLVVAGLGAEGETTVNRVYHLDRGYEHLVDKLRACGADISRVAD
ncbi:MAG: UDP-N-acetylglucosamine 1-carboxyvinyltransferase [Alphaproteobacteria bacterium]|nr:UDP-N-acetylglucosamine 1-carboxyvinyltransferase [Alphaproteobacteria bacterium]